jgi:hypothetical protein
MGNYNLGDDIAAISKTQKMNSTKGEHKPE